MIKSVIVIGIVCLSSDERSFSAGLKVSILFLLGRHSDKKCGASQSMTWNGRISILKPEDYKLNELASC